MLKKIVVTNRSASFEIINDDYYQTSLFKVYLNDVFYKEYTTNVFTMYDLIPNTNYDLRIECSDVIYIFPFKTNNETVLLDVKKFGAKGDGKTNDSRFIQACINACPNNGTVYISKGIYQITTLFLNNDIDIYIDKEAVLIGDNDRLNYPILPSNEDYVMGTWEGKEDKIFASMITGMNNSNVNLYGEGIIDGNAQNGDWWKNHHDQKVAWRPKGIFLNKCENINLIGLTVKNTPSWNQHPFFSNNLNYINMKLINPGDSPTTDGCDPESCDNVNILGTYISVGDDCIAIKSNKKALSYRFKKPCSNITVRNCFMENGHGGVTLGSEMSSGINNVNVSKCIFKNTDRGLRIKTQRGRGKYAIIDGLTFSDIKMENVKAPLVINMFYMAGNDTLDSRFDYEFLPKMEDTPHLGRFTFKNIVATDISYCAGIFLGLPESLIDSISISNSSFTYKENPTKGVPAMTFKKEEYVSQGFIVRNVDNFSLNKVSIDLKQPIIRKNVNHVTIKG